MPRSLMKHAEDIAFNLRELERRDAVAHAELVRVWNMTEPMVRLIILGAVHRISPDSKKDLHAFEAEIDRLLRQIEKAAR